jgi:hypothetical protein
VCVCCLCLCVGWGMLSVRWFTLPPWFYSKGVAWLKKFTGPSWTDQTDRRDAYLPTTELSFTPENRSHTFTFTQRRGARGHRKPNVVLASAFTQEKHNAQTHTHTHSAMAAHEHGKRRMPTFRVTIPKTIHVDEPKPHTVWCVCRVLCSLHTLFACQ